MVRIIAATSTNNGVAAHRTHRLRHDFRRRIGHGEDHRLWCHACNHLRLEHPARREPKKQVSVVDDLVEAAGGGGLRVLRLDRVHQLGAAVPDHASRIKDPDVLARQPEPHQQVEAGQCRGPGTATHQLHSLDTLANAVQGVDKSGGCDNGRAVLIVVEYRDLHALAQLGFDVEALRRLDVLEVDAAKGRFQCGDDAHQLVRVGLGDLQIEHVDACELFEQAALALHHWLAGQWANVAEPEHGGTVSDHGDQVAACGEPARFGGVFGDGETGFGHAR